MPNQILEYDLAMTYQVIFRQSSSDKKFFGLTDRGNNIPELSLESVVITNKHTM